MRDVQKGLEMCDKHIYKMTRWNNGKGGGSKISPCVIEDDIMALVCEKVREYISLLPVKFSDVKPKDIWIPLETWKAMGRITAYLGYHGDSAVIGITLMESIIQMERYGIHDVKQYRELIERLDSSPPQSFKDYIQICIEYEKEMKQ